MITDQGINALLEHIKVEEAKDRVVEVAGKAFALQKEGDEVDGFVELIPAKADAAVPLKASTLTGVLDYLTENHDGHDLTRVTMHVVGPREVHVVGPLRERRDRECFLIATPAGDDVGNLNAFAGQADFVLRLQRFFEDTAERKDLLALVGNLTDEAVRTAADDGVTQIVATKQGSKLGPTTVKNPWMLIPKRSFAEITLEPVPFVLRVKSNGAGVESSIALFEADGGAWKVDAIRKIFAFVNNDKSADGRKWGLVA